VAGAATWAPILDRSTWEWLCRHFATADQRKGGRPTSYLLTGYIWCADCQWRMFGRWKDGRSIYTGQAPRGCQHVVSADPVDTYMGEVVVDLLTKPEVMKALRAAPSGDARATALRDQIDALNLQKRELAKEAAKPGTVPSVIVEAAQLIEAQQAELHDELGRLLPKQRAYMATWAQSMQGAVAWWQGDLRTRRQMLDLVIERVEVRPVGRTTGGKFDSGRVQIVPVPELRSDATVARIVAQVLRRS